MSATVLSLIYKIFHLWLKRRRLWALLLKDNDGDKYECASAEIKVKTPFLLESS